MASSNLDICVKDYLEKRIANLPTHEQKESTEVLHKLCERLGINLSLYLPGVELETVFLASDLAKNGQSQLRTQSTASDDSFKKYVEMLSSRGYFNGSQEGSEDYQQKLNKARGRWEQKFQKPAQALPTQPTLSPEELEKQANQHKDEGNEFIKAKNYKQAIESYTKAIKCNPKNAIIWANRGLAYLKENQFQNCVNDCTQSIRCDPKYDKAYFRLGSAYVGLQKFEDARKAFEDCLAINPQDKFAQQELQKIKNMAPPGAVDAMGGFSGMDGMDGMGGAGGMAGFPGMGEMPGMGGMPGGPMPNFMEMINNPQFMEMASQMVQNNPQIATMAQQIAQNPQVLQQFFGGQMPDISQMFPGGMPNSGPNGTPPQ